MQKSDTKINYTLFDLLYWIVCILVLIGLFKGFVKAHFQPVLVAEAEIQKVEFEDDRVGRLRSFLESKDSPLAHYADVIVADADKFDVGWTKLVSISSIESNYGKKVPQNSFNAWGIGGSNFVYFKSWIEGIHYTSELLGTKYMSTQNQAIKLKYCSSPTCNPNWSHNVTKVTSDILARK